MQKRPMLVTHSSQTAHGRMTDSLRQEIASGKFAFGSQLPSTRELAEAWKTSIFTVHTALKTLVREGWIDRRKGAGTYISDRNVRLRSIGIYHDADISSEMQTSFSRNLHFSLLKSFEEMKNEVHVFIDTRPVSEQKTVLPALARAIAHRRIQGLIVPKTNAVNSAALARLPLPAAFLGNGRNSNRVGFDIEQFFRESARRLATQGCRRVGIISNVGKEDTAFFHAFAQAAEKAGLETSPKWTRSGHGEIQNFEKHGYVEFLSLWRTSPRPDAVIVYPDSVARGVVLGVLEHGAARRMHFAFHRNAQASFLCPFSVTYGISDENQTALALIDLVRKQLAGKSASQIMLPYRFVHESATFGR